MRFAGLAAFCVLLLCRTEIPAFGVSDWGESAEVVILGEDGDLIRAGTDVNADADATETIAAGVDLGGALLNGVGMFPIGRDMENAPYDLETLTGAALDIALHLANARVAVPGGRVVMSGIDLSLKSRIQKNSGTVLGNRGVNFFPAESAAARDAPPSAPQRRSISPVLVISGGSATKVKSQYAFSDLEKSIYGMVLLRDGGPLQTNEIDKFTARTMSSGAKIGAAVKATSPFSVGGQAGRGGLYGGKVAATAEAVLEHCANEMSEMLW